MRRASASRHIDARRPSKYRATRTCPGNTRIGCNPISVYSALSGLRRCGRDATRISYRKKMAETVLLSRTRCTGQQKRGTVMGITKISLSIVSHGNIESVASLLADLARLARADIEVILTLNLPEALPARFEQLPFALKVIENAVPKGFAANHNAAFAVCASDHFVLLNPDIRLLDDPFDILLSLLADAPGSIAAPLVLNEAREIEDSARNFPTPFVLLKKLAGKVFRRSPARDVLRVNGDLAEPDWVAGMFVMVPRGVYQRLHGLSERYHLYYEDVDFCAQ